LQLLRRRRWKPRRSHLSCKGWEGEQKQKSKTLFEGSRPRGKVQRSCRRRFPCKGLAGVKENNLVDAATLLQELKKPDCEIGALNG